MMMMHSLVYCLLLSAGCVLLHYSESNHQLFSFRYYPLQEEATLSRLEDKYLQSPVTFHITPRECLSLESPVYKVSNDGALSGGVWRLPWHNDIISVGIMDLDVHRSPRCLRDWWGTVWKEKKKKKKSKQQKRQRRRCRRLKASEAPWRAYPRRAILNFFPPVMATG